MPRATAPEDDDRDDRDRERAGRRPEEGQQVGGAGDRGERLQHLDVEDVAIDRRPQGQDEPPAGAGQDEADAASPHPEDRPDHEAGDAGDDGDGIAEGEGVGGQVAGQSADEGGDDGPGDTVEDPSLPDVVAARPGHDGDETGIDDAQERHRDPRQEQGGQDRPVGNEREDRQAVEHPQGDEIHRKERVAERIECGPALDQAGRIAQEHRGCFATYRSHSPSPPVFLDLSR